MTKCSPIVSTCDSILKSSLWIPMLYLLLSCSRTSELYRGILVTFLLISETSLSKIILICCSFDKKTSSLRSACFLTSKSFYEKLKIKLNLPQYFWWNQGHLGQWNKGPFSLGPSHWKLSLVSRNRSHLWILVCLRLKSELSF